MTTENDKLRAQIKALLATSDTVLPDYADDPAVKARAGKMLADAAMRTAKEPKSN
jgi:hypothetical protein